MKANNNALSLFVLIKRNIKIYMKDRMNVFFSVLAPIIVLLLYILFLSKMQVDSIVNTPEFLASGLSRADIQSLINNWMISGVMGVSCITVCVNANVCMVRDKQNGVVNDMLSSPVKRWVVYVSYLISTFIIAFCICFIVLMISLMYLAGTGGFFLSFVDVLAILGITVLTCICSSIFVVILCGAIKTVSSLSAVNGVFSTVIGFVIGAYLPFSMIPKALQYVGCFIPGTYSTGLFKTFFMRGIVDNLIGKIEPGSGIIEKLVSQFSLELDFFGMKISTGWMLFTVVLSIVVFALLLTVLYCNKKTNFFSSSKVKKSKKNKNNSSKVKKARNWVGALFMWPFKLFPVKKNRIYFQARYGQQFNCNSRAFFEYLYKHHHDEFEFVWCLNYKDTDLPKDVKRVKFMSLRDRYYIHTSKYVINNNRCTMLFSKRKSQVYILAVHGAVCALKTVEFDQKLPYFTRWNAKVDNGQLDALTVASKQQKDRHSKAFGCEEKTFVTGNPRSDQLINLDLEKANKVREFLKLSEEDFVILYAPTFREHQPYIVLNNQLIKENFEKAMGRKVKILYHFHPRWKKEYIKDVPFGNDVINATPYPEFQDLLLVANVLISDFSSAMFDMMVMGKLCVQNRSEEQSFLENERGLYIPLDQLPFPVVKDDADFQKLVSNLDEVMKEYKVKSDQFLEDVGCVEDGHSCERVYKLMQQLAKKKEKK